MKISKDTQRTARRMFHLCFTNGVLDDAKLRQLIEGLASKKPRNYIPLLCALKEYVEVEIDRHKSVVTSATPLPEAESSLLKKKLTAHHGRDLDIEWKVDPSLIAGLHIRIGDEVFDGTLKTKLENLLNTTSL